ncbi:MAG: hypothetical protein AAF667_06250 [Pseudomonadota bacterium]
METEGIVFVVGAGASKEFKLPVGAELKDQIASLCDIRFDGFGSKLEAGKPQIVETLRILAKSDQSPRATINPYLHAAWSIRDNMHLAPSIDNFLDTHKDDRNIVLMGKLCILDAILEAEKKSSLFHDRKPFPLGINFQGSANTWLGRLFTVLAAQRDFGSFLSALRCIQFISFNYDRCIQQYFCFASESYFGLDSAQVEEVLEAIQIQYVYGSVGEYKWDKNNLAFGQPFYGQRLLDAVDNIKTFTEGVDLEVSELIFSRIDGCRSINFLGFGFLELNMKALLADKQPIASSIRATGKGLSADDRNLLNGDLERMFALSKDASGVSYFGTNLDAFYSGTCSEFITEFGRRLLRELDA